MYVQVCEPAFKVNVGFWCITGNSERLGETRRQMEVQSREKKEWETTGGLRRLERPRRQTEERVGD